MARELAHPIMLSQLWSLGAAQGLDMPEDGQKFSVNSPTRKSSSAQMFATSSLSLGHLIALLLTPITSVYGKPVKLRNRTTFCNRAISCLCILSYLGQQRPRYQPTASRPLLGRHSNAVVVRFKHTCSSARTGNRINRYRDTSATSPSATMLNY
jgi:hypothetical protein